ncbi:MAG: box helicase protein [Chthonomonadales bacterium]|nr:box helicase protein [Chthonomonadales bacterium]
MSPIKTSKKTTTGTSKTAEKTPVEPAAQEDVTALAPTPVETETIATETVAMAPPTEAETPEVNAETAVPEEIEENNEPEIQAAAFRALKLSEPTMRAIIEAGFEAPTPIQEQSIPILIAGHDLIGQAQTGTGKTAAFALPMAELLDPNLPHPQAIILLPTRELCIQVAQETHTLSKFTRLRVVPVYGGQPIDRQFRALSFGAHIVVGTPGRVLDHLRRGTLKLGGVKMVVLDEADEMLNMGFLEDVEEILKSAPEARQTALFSATMPPRIAALARTYLRDPQRVTIESKRRTVELVTQTYYEVPPSQKVEALTRILDMESPGSTILFCRTRRDVDDLGESLQMRGYQAETLHGDMNQAARDRVMARFRSGQADLLIATDVAARGLDIDQVTHVINYDIPWDVEAYIHRIGRTGRAGRSGDAITLVSPRERYQLRQIERYINAPILPARVPTVGDIAARRRELFKDKLRETLAEGNCDGYLVTVGELVEEGKYDAPQIAAAALQMLWQGQKGAEDYDISAADLPGTQAEQGMTRLFLQIGRQDGVRPGDIVGAIANEAGISGNAIGAIEILDRSTYVEVPENEANRVIEALNRTKLRGKKVYVEIARPRTDGPPEQDRPRPPFRPDGGGGGGGGRFGGGGGGGRDYGNGGGGGNRHPGGPPPWAQPYRPNRDSGPDYDDRGPRRGGGKPDIDKGPKHPRKK